MGFRLLAFAAVLACAGCSLFSSNPYSNFTIGEVEQPEVDEAAVIVVGDPQVIMRETLINDRIRESAFLGDLIDRSDEQRFGPQVLRDLTVVEAFAAQLGISFNPAAGREFERDEDVADLRTEIELLRLRTELEELRRLSEEDPSDPSFGSGEGNGNGNGGGGPQEGEMGADMPDHRTAGITLEELNKAIQEVNKVLTSLGGRQARSPQSTASPEQQFADHSAYRALLRQRQSEAQLDDVHDVNGNTLYRLQFTASVFPGQETNRYGVLDVDLQPPRMGQEELQSLYENWLISLMDRSFQEEGQPSSNIEWERNQSSLLRKGYFERAVVDEKLDDGRTREHFTVFTYPGDSEVIIDLISRGPTASRLIDQAKELTGSIVSRPTLNTTNCLYRVSNGNALDYLGARNVVRAFRSISAFEVFLSSLEDKVRFDIGDASYADDLGALESQILESVVAATRIVDYYVEGTVGTECSARFAEIEGRTVPAGFVEGVTRERNEGENTYELKGEIYTYQAQPTERVQRLSTVASAVNSMQAAFSLAASLPGQGIGLDAGASASRNAVGLVEAIERSPLVIGYTDRRSPRDGIAGSGARFGYLFGPVAVLVPDQNELEYRQIPASHAVFADLSIPSWWREVKLEARSVWAGDWRVANNGLGTVIDGVGGTRSMTVRLRPPRSSFDALTAFLAGQVTGTRDRPRIESVVPQTVASCENEVRFVVEGDHLWRNPTVFLRGQQQRSVEVLPDMGGIAVTFNINSLPKSIPSGEDEDANRIVVWTSLGKARAAGDANEITFLRTINGVPCPRDDGQVVQLRAASPRFVNNSQLRIVAESGLPPAAREVQVVGQIRDSNDEWLPKVTVVALGPEDGIYRGNINFQLESNIAPGQVDGAQMRVGLSYRVVDGGARRDIWAERQIVYYPTATDSQFGIDSGMKVSGFDTTIMVDVPANVEAAFPGFRRESNAFAAVIKGHGGVRLRVTADWGSEENGRIPISIAWLGQPEGSEADRSFFTQWCKGDQEIQLSVSNPQGREVPAFPNAKVILEKGTEGCPTG